MNSIKPLIKRTLKNNRIRISDNDVDNKTLQNFRENEKIFFSVKPKNRIECIEERLKYLDNLYNQKSLIIKKLFE